MKLMKGFNFAGKAFVSAIALTIASTVPAAADMPEKPETLRLFLDTERERLARPALDAFEAEHGIEIETQTVPYDRVFDQMTSMIAGGQTLDVIFMSNSWHAEMGAVGLLMDIEPYIDQEWLDNYVPVGLEMMASGGTQWGLPAQPAILYFFYNADMLAELGYDEAPETWHELAEISNEAVEADLADHGMFVGMAPLEGLMVYYDSFLKQFGGSWINEDHTEWTFNSDEAVAAGEFMRDMIDQGVFAEAGLETPDRNSMSSFNAGRAPFHWNWSFAWREMTDPEISSVTEAAQPTMVPVIPEGTGESYTVLGGGGFAVAATTQHPEWSVELLKAVTGPIAAEFLIDQFGSEGAWAPLFEDDQLLEDNPLLALYQEQVQYGGFRPSDYLTWYSEFRDNMFLPRFHDALSGNRDMREALDAAQEEAQQRLDAAGL